MWLDFADGSRFLPAVKLARKYTALYGIADPVFPLKLNIGYSQRPDHRFAPSQFFSNEVQKQTGLHYNGAACEHGSSENLYKTKGYEKLCDGTICATFIKPAQRLTRR